MVLYVNGKFHTMNVNRSVVDAIAVKDGVIRYVGDSRNLIENYPDDEDDYTKVVDLAQEKLNDIENTSNE